MTNEIEQTARRLLAISEDRFVKAVMALEQTENADVQKIKDLIRRRIAQTRPPRRINLTRIFCEPFEEMLRDTADNSTSWIPRSAIVSCWSIVEPLIGAPILNAIREEVRTLLRPSQEKLWKLGAPLWAAAAKALGNIAIAAQNEKSVEHELLSSKGILSHAAAIAGACQVVPAIQELKTLFPNRPFEGLQAADRGILVAELKRIGTNRTYDLRCVIHLIAHWTSNPAEIFKLCNDIDLGAATPLGKVLFNQREKVVLGLLDEQIGALKQNIDTDEIKFTECMVLANTAAESLDSAIGLMKGGPSAGAEGRVAQMKRDVTQIVKERVVTVAARTVSSMWGGKQKTETLDADTIANAEEAARAMVKCGKLVSKFGADRTIDQQIASSLKSIRSDVADMVSDLKGGSTPDKLTSAQAMVTNATRMVEILEGSDRAYQFFRANEAEINART